MAKTKNPVKYGLKSLFAAVLTITTDENTGAETYTYGTPIRWPGAVSLSLDQQGQESTFAADDDARYFDLYNNSGRSGTLETALIPQTILEAVYGDTVDSNGVLWESEDEPKEVALLYEYKIQGEPVRQVLYRCKLSRPALGSSTMTDNTTPVTEPITVTSLKRSGGKLSAARTTATVNATVFANWFDSVYERPAQSGGGG